jgi:hypothetical protein
VDILVISFGLEGVFFLAREQEDNLAKELWGQAREGATLARGANSEVVNRDFNEIAKPGRIEVDMILR